MPMHAKDDKRAAAQLQQQRKTQWRREYEARRPEAKYMRHGYAAAQGQAAYPRHDIVDPLRLESGAMNRLVQQREQEDYQDALRQHQQRPERHLGCNQRSKDHNRTPMSAELNETRSVGLGGQATALLRGQ